MFLQVANISAVHGDQAAGSEPDQCGFPQYGSFDPANGERELIINHETPMIIHKERSLEVELRTTLSAAARLKPYAGGANGWAAPRFWGLSRFEVTMKCMADSANCSVIPPGPDFQLDHVPI